MLANTALAQELNLCAVPAGQKTPAKLQIGITFDDGATELHGHIQLTVDPDGLIEPHGAIMDGASNTLAFAEVRLGSPGAALVCEDVNGDQIAGIVSLTVMMLDVRDGEVVQVAMTPIDDEIDSSEEEITVVIGGTTHVAGAHWSWLVRVLP
jgi:hypothetical protein